jgi:diaminopimelate decarboxylase
MNCFYYRDNQLYVENISLQTIAAIHETPCYVYSKAAIVNNWLAFDIACQQRRHLICFAVKANSNLAILKTLAKLGAGFDIVSIGELERVLIAGGNPRKVIFSGVGKRTDELRRALLVGIRCFNLESQSEITRLHNVAHDFAISAPVAVRVNPNVDAGTHPYISTGLKENKFGIDIKQAVDTYLRIAELEYLNIQGIACHIGSQLTSTAPFLDALEHVLELAQTLEQHGINIKHLDLGGGLGIKYTNEAPTEPASYVASLEQRLGSLPYELLLEPGRSIVGNAGVLLTTVEYLKITPHKQFAIVDAAMNDLLRPSLYQAVQDIVPVNNHSNVDRQMWDIVGPVCETGDFLGKQRYLALQESDVLAVLGSGAYGFTMSSNYNSRPRVAEILVDDTNIHVVRKRESISDLFAHEIDILFEI